jgi:hypothetical protein
VTSDQAKLPGNRVVGTEPGRVDDLIGMQLAEVIADHGHTLAIWSYGSGTEPGYQLDLAALDEGAQVGGELTSGGQLIGLGVALADQRAGCRGAGHPDDLSAWGVASQLREGEQAGGGGVAGADHQDSATREPGVVTAEDVGQPGDHAAVGDGGGLPEGGQAVGAERVGLGPGPEVSITPPASRSCSSPAPYSKPSECAATEPVKASATATSHESRRPLTARSSRRTHSTTFQPRSHAQDSPASADRGPVVVAAGGLLY